MVAGFDFGSLFDSAVRLSHFKSLKVISLLSSYALKHALHEATGWRFLTTEGKAERISTVCQGRHKIICE